MKRELLLRELEAYRLTEPERVDSEAESKPSLAWSRPTDAYSAGQIDQLIALIRYSGFLRPVYDYALGQKFDLKGRVSVLDRQEYERIGGPKGSDGFTDKKKAQAYLLSHFNNGPSNIESAIHEAIHLLSHPYKSTLPNKATFKSLLGPELYEALTQYFTRIVMQQCQFIGWETKTYSGHITKHLVPFFRIFKELGVSNEERNWVLKRLYFYGDTALLLKCLNKAVAVVLNKPDTDAIVKGHTTAIWVFIIKKSYNDAVACVQRLKA